MCVWPVADITFVGKCNIVGGVLLFIVFCFKLFIDYGYTMFAKI